MNRRREVLSSLRGLRLTIRRTRNDLQADHTPQVTGRLWKAELEIQKAEEAVQAASTKQP